MSTIVNCWDTVMIYRYFHEFNQRIPRDEVIQLRDIAFERISEVDEKIIATVCGSFRRGTYNINLSHCGQL